MVYRGRLRKSWISSLMSGNRSEDPNDRMDTLGLLIGELHDLVDSTSAAAEWVKVHKGKSWSAGRDSRGELKKWQGAADKPPPGLTSIPPEVLRIFEALLTDPDPDRRYVELDSIETIMLDTQAVYIDDEKLLGHLVRTHDVPINNIAASNEAQLAQHAALHMAAKRHNPKYD